jgi:hypothetical protein
VTDVGRTLRSGGCRSGALAAVTAIWLGALSLACHGGPRGEHASVLSTVREAGEPGASGGVSSTPMLGDADVVEAHVSPGTPPFGVLARTPRLTKAPCANCHTVPLEAMRWDGSDGRATAHWQVRLVHASAQVMTCTTCHAASGLDRLRTLTGAEVSFDHAYEICAQCHSTQKADWEGGAHGKRAGGWAPPRVIYNCTECHNPHRPAFDTRWPARAGRVER